MSADLTALYAAVRGRVSDLLREVGDEGAATPVPLCPGWSVHDVVSHLVGACADVLDGNLEGVATDAWTAAQVDKRRDATVADLVAEWDEKGGQVGAMLPAFPGRAGSQVLVDASTHEADIRHALGRPGARDGANWDVGADFVVRVIIDPTFSAQGLGPVEITAGTQRWLAGGGSGDAVVNAEVLMASVLSPPTEEPERGPAVGSLLSEPFELVRALTGRRSLAQVAAMKWDGVDARAYAEAAVAYPFSPAPADVDE
jgi:uncharacterized protein (TIGR03083 family)